VAIRLLLLLQWPDRLSGDEATVGLMALRILRGEFPIFYAGQGYLGAMVAYLTAVVYLLAGVSALTLKVTVFLFSCLLPVIAFLMGKRMAGWRGGLTCALLTALAPPFLPVFGNDTRLGYMEVVVVGSLVLLLALDLATDERGRAPRERKLLLAAFLAGLGWWINPMTLSYVAAAGLFLLFRRRLWSLRALWAVPLAFVLGSVPFWVFNATHSFWTFALLEVGRKDFRAALESTVWRLLEIAGVADALIDPVPWLSPVAGVVYLALVGVLLVELARRIPRPEPEVRVRRRGLQLLLLFSLLHLTAFAFHRFAPLGGTQRYLFPLYSSLPVLTGIALLRVWEWSRVLAVAALGMLLLNNTLALAHTVEFFEARRRQDWWKPEPVVELLRSQGLTRAYAGWEVAGRLTFETQERIVVTELFGERYRPYEQWVDASPRVAYVLVQRQALPARWLEWGLQAISAGYRRKDFGEFSVFYDFHPLADGPLVSLPPVGWRAVANPPGTDPARAFDRDVDTAWLSAKPLQPGMWYGLDLGELVPIGGITILPVRSDVGLPKGYQLEVSRDGRSWDAVASVPEFDVTVRWRDGQPRVDQTGHVISLFPPRPVRYVRITQMGADPKEGWAIAELFIYGPARVSPPEGQEPSAHLREGLRLGAEGRWGLAVAAYERAVRLDPESEAAHWRLAEAYQKAGLPPDGSDPYQRGLVFERLGMASRALQEYERLLGPAAEDGQHSDVLHRLAELYRRQGKPERAADVERRLREDYAPPVRADVRFGRSARLLGYGLEPREPHVGEVVALSYYWQALRRTTEDLTVFVHFVQGGKIGFGQDHGPLHGRYPTSQWKEGELVRERYRVRLPETLPPGEYDVWIGLWNAETGKRLGVADTALPHARSHVRLATVRVLPPR
jgi:hypothetical protein